MKRFEGQTFERFYDEDSGRVFRGTEFNGCAFVSSAISITKDPRRRSIVQGVRLKNCVVSGCMLYSAIVEDVEVDALKTLPPQHGLLVWGAVFKHVTVRGKVGRVLLNRQITGFPTADEQHAFDVANAEYYRDVDWALDIRHAEFHEADIRSVPARLIRRDPETQVIVTRRKALQGDWRNLDLSKTYWPQAIELMLREEREDEVLVAPKQSPEFEDLLQGLRLLQGAGVAEPD